MEPDTSKPDNIDEAANPIQLRFRQHDKQAGLQTIG